MKCPLHNSDMVVELGEVKDHFQDILFRCPERHRFINRIRLYELLPSHRKLPPEEFEEKAAASLIHHKEGSHDLWSDG